MILGVICLAQLTVLLDNTVLNVAIPSLTRELDAPTADVQWMINAYSLVQSGLLLTAGSSADRYGRRKMLLAGLVLFGVGSLVAGLAQSSGQLIAARAGMGVGGALLIATTLAVVVRTFDDTERVKVIGIWSTANSLGFAVGPLIGGALLALSVVALNSPAWGLGPTARSPNAANGLRVAVLGAVLNSRFAALVPAAVGAASLPAALAAAGGDGERQRITDAFSAGLQTSQLVGAVAVLAGGLLAAVLLRRAERAESALADPAVKAA